MQPSPPWRTLAGIALTTLLAGCSTDIVRSAPRADDPTQPQAETPIPLSPYFRGLKTVNLSIGGKAYAFLFDTAGGRTLLAPELATTFGCRPWGRDVGYRMHGEAVVFRNCDKLEASLSSFAVRVAPVAVFDINGLLPPELPRLHGVLALDSFRGQVVTIDWARNLVVVHSRESADHALRLHGVPVRLATGENGAGLATLVPVAAARDRLWFLLDSGNIRGTLVARQLVEDGSIRLDSGSVAEVRVGSRPAEPMPVLADDINYDGVLGADFLQANVITLDLRRAP